MFRHVWSSLAERRRIVAPDRLGSGFSDHPAEPISLAAYAEATLEALEQIGVDRFDVVGIHTGSCEAIELAANHPDRVRSSLSSPSPSSLRTRSRSTKTATSTNRIPMQDGSHLDWYWRWWRDGGFGGAAERSKRGTRSSCTNS